MNSLDKNIRRNAITGGILLGVVLTGLTIFSFYYITVLATSPMLFLIGPTVISIVIPMIIVVLFCFYIRKKIGGYWSLRQATTGVFIMFIIAYVIQVIGRDVIFARIEPDMARKTETAFENALQSFKKKPGANAKQIDQNLSEIKKSFEDQKTVSIGHRIQGMAISIIFIFVIALVFGALFKKEPPLYADVEQLDPTA